MVFTEGGVVTGKTLQADRVKNDDALSAKCEAILKIFGSSGADKDDEAGFGPTRASFSDCYLDTEWKKRARDNRWTLSEVKSENSINRIKGTAENPRFYRAGTGGH